MSSHLLRQSLPFLLAAGLLQLGSGSLLGLLAVPLRDHPEILIMIPALLGLKGSLEVSLGSRLGSALHLGLWGKGRFWNRELGQNILGAAILTLIGTLLVGLFGYGLAAWTDKTTLSLFEFVAIALMAGLGAGSLLIGVTVFVVYESHRKGLDPDNVTAPILTTVSDLSVLAWLLLAVGLLTGGA